MRHGMLGAAARQRWVRRIAPTLLLVLVGCSGHETRPSITPVARIPFVLDATGLPTFAATVDGSPVRLFLDTGGYKAIALKQDAIRRTGVAYDASSASANDAQGHAYVARSFTAASFNAGSLSLSPARGADLPDFGSHGYPQDGYVGYGVLKNYVLVIDYSRGDISMYDPADGPAVLRSECGAHTFAAEVKNAVIQATVETDAGERVFQFDTGANRNVARPLATASADQTEMTFTRFRLGNTDLGPMTFRLIPYRAPDVDGVLGREFFAAHRVCLDLGAGKGALR